MVTYNQTAAMSLAGENTAPHPMSTLPKISTGNRPSRLSSSWERQWRNQNSPTWMIIHINKTIWHYETLSTTFLQLSNQRYYYEYCYLRSGVLSSRTYDFCQQTESCGRRLCDINTVTVFAVWVCVCVCDFPGKLSLCVCLCFKV